MSKELTRRVGLEHETPGIAMRANRPVELFASVALALCTLVAVTAVTIGIARADVPHSDADAAPFALALFIGLLLSGMGGLTAIMAEDRTRRE